MTTRARAQLLVAVGVLLLAAHASAFYLPGIAPYDYEKHEKVLLKVNQLTSTKTQIPYKYYWLPYCQPDSIVDARENIGEMLHGDRIENSPYKLMMGVDEYCKVLCVRQYNKKELKRFNWAVSNDYRVNWIVDNLPAATRVYKEQEGSMVTFYERGFRVGFSGAERDNTDKALQYLHNHVRIIIEYHPVEKTRDGQPVEGHRVVTFSVEPFSVAHTENEVTVEADGRQLLAKCNTPETRVTHKLRHLPILIPKEDDAKVPVVWSYDVVWSERTDIKWASRWDLYLMMHDDQIHWFSIVNSLMIVLFLTLMVAMIMMRTLRRDFTTYNSMETAEEAQEETGWKLVHGDVFRPPGNSNLLCTLVGTGTQLLFMTSITLVFAVLGFLSPAYRGGLLTAMLLLYMFMAYPCGYVSSRLYKMFRGMRWMRLTFFAATVYPCFVAVVFLVLNFVIWGEKSSGAVPFGTLFTIFFFWFCISVPLALLGSYVGFKEAAIEHPVRTNQIPRQIPEQAWYMRPGFSVLVGGILPFGAVFIELFFIMSSIWLHQFYYVFGILFIVFVILLVTCAEITIVLCYFQLCAEDYHWWWRSFLTSGSSALFLFLYSIFYYVSKLEIENFASGLLYFGYMLLVSVTFFVLTGTIGFAACFWFVRKIYGSIKVD